MNTKFSFVCCSLMMILVTSLSGCFSLNFDSPGDKQEKPLSDRWYVACVYGGCWWTDDPAEVCKIQGQDGIGGVVKDNGFRRINVESNFLSLFASFITFGIAVPVYVECYEEKLRPRRQEVQPIIDL